ncbi:hypothetical protein BBJ28_00013214 [Nothophytophthora sp. Chile5]|nr:hypothetical protein BBJ28_00013214 [Nothophytophthora sp. Chile5]
MSAPKIETVVLARECEYRVEVPAQAEVGVRLKSGSAELFGVELAIGNEYVFRDKKLAIFTWYGCTLEVRGAPEVAYTSDETPMDSYLNIHAQLQRRRELARAKHGAGPRVLVCGPVDSGKSTLTQILANYALRLGEKPTFVELDVGRGCLSVPGTLAASPLDMNSLSVAEEFILTNPLAFFYGYTAPTENVELFRYQQQRLATAVKRRLANDEEVNASGCVVNTGGWVDGVGFDLLVHAIQDLEVDVVLVIGQDRLFSRLQSAFGGANPPADGSSSAVERSIVKLARSGGVVPLNSKLRSAARLSRIREYFYGAHSLSVPIPTLSPCINEFSFDDVKEIRETDQKLVLLVPSPGPLPSRNLLLGSIKWME